VVPTGCDGSNCRVGSGDVAASGSAIGGSDIACDGSCGGNVNNNDDSSAGSLLQALVQLASDLKPYSFQLPLPADNFMQRPSAFLYVQSGGLYSRRSLVNIKPSYWHKPSFSNSRGRLALEVATPAGNILRIWRGW
jgi:hypothetical protein